MSLHVENGFPAIDLQPFADEDEAVAREDRRAESRFLDPGKAKIFVLQDAVRDEIIP